jgi:hypothetical protein
MSNQEMQINEDLDNIYTQNIQILIQQCNTIHSNNCDRFIKRNELDYIDNMLDYLILNEGLVLDSKYDYAENFLEKYI